MIFEVVSDQNGNAFKTVFVAPHLIRGTSLSMAKAVLQYSKPLHPRKKCLLSTFDTPQPLL